MTRLFPSLATAIGLTLVPLAALAAESPTVVPGATTVTAQEAFALFEQGVAFIDVRKASDFAAGRIPGAVHLDHPGNTAPSNFTGESLGAVVGKTDPVVIYCNGHSCLRSSEASTLAVGWGYSAVNYLRDGYPAWEAAGFPIE
ncbi:rhodanese-like domain-containing protein [Pontitalea aquivivens]|uniref:rhodanese-like domain-containing protein n=1 Tax=Pontitalea aquivivens TaxID=3388663 RepID=UPI00397106EC